MSTKVLNMVVSAIKSETREEPRRKQQRNVAQTHSLVLHIGLGVPPMQRDL